MDTTEGAVRATPRGNLRKKRFCTGDEVDVSLVNKDTNEGQIVKVHRRRTFLPRPPVANLDLVVFVGTVIEPKADLETFDRFIISAEYHDFVPMIVLNKCDLLASKEDIATQQSILGTYTKIGYKTLSVSAETGIGLDLLGNCMRDAASMLAGPSGVGKSTILSELIPDREFVIGDLSLNTRRGTHTTTTTTLIPLPQGGYVADTPGFAFFDLPDIAEENLWPFFPEFEEPAGSCKFNNCLHMNEPGCAVKPLVESGEISHSRYDNYLKFFNILKTRWEKFPDKKPV